MFTIRVYGIWINRDRILLCKEKIREKDVVKFPGGGLEYGEGTIDCLKREFREELAVDIENIRHFYTTDFFVESAFRSDQQVISIYYLLDADPEKIAPPDDEIEFFWKDISSLSENDVTLIIDKKVVRMLTGH